MLTSQPDCSTRAIFVQVGNVSSKDLFKFLTNKRFNGLLLFFSLTGPQLNDRNSKLYLVLPSPRPTTICINPPKLNRTWLKFLC